MTRRELAIAAPLVVLAIVFGVYPQLIFDYVEPTVNNQVETLAEWTRSVHDGAGRKALVPAATLPVTVDSQVSSSPISLGGER